MHRQRLIPIVLALVLLLAFAQVLRAAPSNVDGSLGHSVTMGTHLVRPGDTLWQISQRYRTTVDSIQQINNLTGTMIYVGQVLTVPTRVIMWRNQEEAPPVELPGSGAAAEVIRLTNAERAKNGLSPLAGDSALAAVAQEKANDMWRNGYFSHYSPTYGSPFEMMTKFGVTYTYAAENIAKGYRDASSVVAGWMGSSGHRANILNAHLTRIGVGVAGDVWVQMFRTP